MRTTIKNTIDADIDTPVKDGQAVLEFIEFAINRK